MHYLLKYYKGIIENYQGEIPLIVFLKDFFRVQKQLGKRDRGALTEAVFAYYRTLATSKENNINPWEVLYQNKEEEGWSYWKFLLENRVERSSLENFYLPLKRFQEYSLSSNLEQQDFMALLQQSPKVFFRKYTPHLPEELAIEASYRLEVGNRALESFKVTKDTKLQNFFADHEYVVQDLSSQKVLKACLNTLPNTKDLKIWDACAGAGGKSIMLRNLLEDVDLVASDIRKSILKEFHRRQELYFGKSVATKVYDLSKEGKLPFREQDVVLLDVPCSGSGTWGRTPERALFFYKKEFENLQQKQLAILTNAKGAIKNEAYIFYITCSVFREENEEIVAQFLAENEEYDMLAQELIWGLEDEADALFYTVLKKK